jgi:hypothetical protein
MLHQQALLIFMAFFEGDEAQLVSFYLKT